ncbi:DUF6262 family protein [Streptomyces sp. OE57]|uniref:DUF6262 family protein n=1 Tax=Streptomyces lacaronensis TaxID=3379885 RepID=UPI0039B72557
MSSGPTSTAANAARREQTRRKLTQVETAIGQLRRERGRLTVRAIAKRAGVSATFCYENVEARSVIQNATAACRTQHDRQAHEEHERIEASWRERALNAEAERTRAQKEIFADRQQIGELMGRLRDFDQMVPGESVQHLVNREHQPQAPSSAGHSRTSRSAGATRRRPLQPSVRREAHRCPRSPTSRTGTTMTAQATHGTIPLNRQQGGRRSARSASSSRGW